ncbi:hypothetical protein RY72_00270 [Akkermansia muciniphila]|nr:hypothetical protein [Akkermansia muciniphila]
MVREGQQDQPAPGQVENGFQKVNSRPVEMVGLVNDDKAGGRLERLENVPFRRPGGIPGGRQAQPRADRGQGVQIAFFPGGRGIDKRSAELAREVRGRLGFARPRFADDKDQAVFVLGALRRGDGVRGQPASTA